MSIIMHVDMDAFYASVELRRRPDLMGRPMAVGGAGRGVVLSATYEARAAGVRSGIPMTRARRLCPGLVVVQPDFDTYADTSDGVFAIFRTMTPLVESASIDEAFLDVTGAARMWGSPQQIGERIRALVADEQGINCSVGVGPSKFVAKLASRQAKPDGMCVVPPDQVIGFLHPLPVERIWGVGEATAEKLHRLGLMTIEDIAHTPRDTLRRGLGVHLGGWLHDLAWGRDTRVVIATEPERSIGSQETFSRETDDPDIICRELLRMADKTAARLRQARMFAQAVTISIRFADFTTITRTGRLTGPTDTADELYARALQLWARLGLQRARIRRVGVRAEQLVEESSAYRQPVLGEPDHGWREVEQAMDAAVERFGPHAVRRAELIGRKT